MASSNLHLCRIHFATMKQIWCKFEKTFAGEIYKITPLNQQRSESIYTVIQITATIKLRIICLTQLSKEREEVIFQTLMLILWNFLVLYPWKRRLSSITEAKVQEDFTMEFQQGDLSSLEFLRTETGGKSSSTSEEPKSTLEPS